MEVLPSRQSLPLFFLALATAACDPSLGDDDDGGPPGGDDDDSSPADDDDDDATVPSGDCSMEEIGGEFCVEAGYTDLDLPALPWECPAGDFDFRSEADWESFLLDDCGGFGEDDPLQGFDWESWFVVGSIWEGGGCTSTQGFLWNAECDGYYVLASWFQPCGLCDMWMRTQAWVALPTWMDDWEIERVSCVPQEAQCDETGEDEPPPPG